jgi:hypothetical protein
LREEDPRSSCSKVLAVQVLNAVGPHLPMFRKRMQAALMFDIFVLLTCQIDLLS